MTGYLAGVLIGRFIMSILIVFVLVLVFSRFKLKSAFKSTFSWKGMLGITLLFLTGLFLASAKLYQQQSASLDDLLNQPQIVDIGTENPGRNAVACDLA